MSDTIEIVDSVREGARLIIGIAGESGSGKTYTALKLAHGLANGDASKIGFLDAENKRGALYSNMFAPAKFKRGDLYPPFSPQRYIDGIKKFQEIGVEVLVIDSISHSWEGEGGCEDIANAGGKMPNWKAAKREHKRMMGAILFCDMHIIMCIRAREKTDFKDPRAPKSLGVQPICEKNMMFEMTASLMMWDSGKQQQILKCPDELLPILGRGTDYITELDGRALRQWVDGGLFSPIDTAKNKLRFAAMTGSESLKQAWEQLPKSEQKALTGTEFVKSVKAQAAAVDAGEPLDEPAIDAGGEE